MKKAMPAGRQGFTLVETLIYIAIIGGIMVTFVSFSFNVSGSRNKTYSVEEVQANLRDALSVIKSEIMFANGVNTSTSVFDLDPGVLSLSVLDVNNNPTIISLSSDDGLLQVKKGENPTSTITTNEVKVTNLVFENLFASSTKENVGVDVTIEFANSASSTELQFSKSFKTNISIRN